MHTAKEKIGHIRKRILCYVYSLPPCYFTQSALPIYQTGGCSVYYTCDLSRVTDFARCRLFAQLGHTLGLVSGDRGHWSQGRVDKFASNEKVVSAYDRIVSFWSKTSVSENIPVDIVDARIVYSYYFVLTITSSFA